jgi:DNA-binding NarL/FixJ family response regulator
MAIGLLIVDDHEVVRAGLKTLLQGSDIRVVGEASDGNAGFRLANKHRPDVVLLDVRMPEGDGLNCLARIKLDLPDIPVVMFSAHDNPTYIARSVALGAAGYLLKSSTKKQLIEAIRSAAGGETIWTRDELRRLKTRQVCPLDNREWDFQKYLFILRMFILHFFQVRQLDYPNGCETLSY